MLIKEIALEQRPRERLKSKGIESLNDSELLALILEKGTNGENVIDLSHRLISTFSLDRLNSLSLSELMKIKGIGPKTIRSLALISDLIYGTKASWKDPVKYSFAHGGKGGIPYPVNRKLMDNNTELLQNAIKDARLGNKDKINAIRRLNHFIKC